MPMPVADNRFPRRARLLKTDEFSSVFRLRSVQRSEHFVLYMRSSGSAARLGLVIGRKFARRAVSRNVIRRLAREAFRLTREPLDGWDVLLRLHRRYDSPEPGRPRGVRLACRAELEALLEFARRHAARAGRVQAQTLPAQVTHPPSHALAAPARAGADR